MRIESTCPVPPTHLGAVGGLHEIIGIAPGGREKGQKWQDHSYSILDSIYFNFYIKMPGHRVQANEDQILVSILVLLVQ